MHRSCTNVCMGRKQFAAKGVLMGATNDISQLECPDVPVTPLSQIG